MGNQWCVLSPAQDADHYARVESQIADLDLALALLDRAARSLDPELLARVSQLARETCACATEGLSTLAPDRDQSARIGMLMSELQKRLSARPPWLPQARLDDPRTKTACPGS
jgi:hypothetical protein